MSTLIAIDENLIESAEDFVSRWNSDPECVEAAIAEAVTPKPDLVIEVIGAILVTLSTGVLTNAIYDLLLGNFKRAGVEVTFEDIEMPDGTKIKRIIERRGD